MSKSLFKKKKSTIPFTRDDSQVYERNYTTLQDIRSILHTEIQECNNERKYKSNKSCIYYVIYACMYIWNV